MQKKLPAALVLTLLLGAGLTAFAQDDNVPRMTVAELSKLMKANKVVVLDVRSAEVYKAGHLPGALSIPLTELAQRWQAIPKGKPIVAYCT